MLQFVNMKIIYEKGAIKMMSRHKTKRVLAIILALMLVLGALPVYAAEADPIEVTFVSEQHEMDSLMGSEGDNQQYSPTPQMPERASVSRHIDGGTNITRGGEIPIAGFSTPAPVAYAHDEDSLWDAMSDVFWYWLDYGITVPRIIYLQDDIELSDWGSLLIHEGTDITLRSYGDVMHTLSIDTYWWYRVGVVFVEAGAYLTLDGIRVADGGGEVYFGGGVMNWGNLTMISGEISGNTALVSGGGVANMGTFTMYGGIITGNNVTGDNTAGDGGGVANWGTFIMGSESDPSLNPQITYNTAQPWNGGGVFNMNTFTMHSGVISGNEAGNNGGGVMNWDGTVIMNGGTITGNSATHGGGVRNNGTFTLNNGTISNNTITNWGAGVDNADTFVMWNGTITNNESTVWSGGGVANRASFTMHNGTISNNTAPSNGGGVHSPGAFTIHGGTISGNTAPWGGGVWSDSTFNMTGGYIINNYGTYRGVLFGANISSMTMSGGIVFGGLLGRWVPRTGTALVWDGTTTEFVEGTSTELSTAPDNTAVWGIQGVQYGIVFNGTFIHVPGVSVWSTDTPPTFIFDTQQGVALAGTSSTVSFLITGPASTSMDIRGPIPPGIAFRGHTHFGQQMIFVDIAATVPAGTYHFVINFSVPGHPLIPSNGIDVVVSESRTVTFDLDDGTHTGGQELVQIIPYGGNAIPPTELYRPGFNFIAWEPEGAYNNVTSDRTITAQWAAPTAPSVPQGFTATVGNTEVTLSWTAPASNGGSAITGYEVSSDNGETWVAADSDIGHTFTGLTNGTEYTFRVRAVNSVGNGAEASETATPLAVIDIKDKQGVTVPVLGNAPVTSITPTVQFTGTVEWEHSGGTVGSTFGASSIYTATITLTPETGFTLQGVLADSFNVSGATSVSNPANSGVITAVFPATAAQGGNWGGGGGGTPVRNAQTPNITQQPQNTMVQLDGSATLSITANVTDGGTLTFQWFSNTTNSNTGGTAIQGATDREFTPSTDTLGTVYYYVVVTNTNNDVNGDRTATRASDAAAVTVTDTPPTDQFPFIDVAATDWFYPYVRTVWENQLFQGTSHNMFTPQGSMTRAMFVQVLANMEGVNLAAYRTQSPAFGDTNTSAWYFPAIQWAAGQGLVQGVGDGNFAPGRAITCEEIAVMLHNYVVSRNITLPQETTRTFSDHAAISDWAVEGVAAIQAAGIIVGRPDGSFAPSATATRAEVATIFARFLEVTGVISPAALSNMEVYFDRSAQEAIERALLEADSEESL